MASQRRCAPDRRVAAATQTGLNRQSHGETGGSGTRLTFIRGLSDTAEPDCASPFVVRPVLPSPEPKDSAHRTVTFSVLGSPVDGHRFRRFGHDHAVAGALLKETCDWLRLNDKGLSLAAFCQLA